MTITQDILDLASARVAAYTFLSTFLRREASSDAIAQLVNGEASGECDASEANVRDGLAVMAAFVREACGEACNVEKIESCRHILASDFAHIFLLGKGCVHPYESVYTSDKGLLMREAYRAARLAYADAGFVVGDSSDEMADHAAIELEFMAHLAQRVHDALLTGDIETARVELNRQRAFIERRISWLNRLADDIEAAAQTDFYRGFACMLRDTLKADIGFMDEMASSVARGFSAA